VIYTNWIAAGIVLALIVAGLDGWWSFLEALAGLAVGAAVFGAFYVVALLLYRDVRVVSLGMGDVWLAAMIGAMTGDVRAAIGTLFYGILLGALGAGVLLVARRGSQVRALPSGSYLCAGALIGLALQVW
jgi:leader peptidase (prepilin peptidase)/N-methyltransferase